MGRAGEYAGRHAVSSPEADVELTKRRDDSKGPVTQCRFSTLEPEEIMNHPFDEESQ